MGSLINRYCKTGRCESQYFVEDGGDRKDGKTKVFTFKEGIKRIEEIGKDDPEYKERKIKDRGIDGIIDWGYDMYAIFLIDADEVDYYKVGGYKNYDEDISISDKTLDQFELVDTDGVEYEIWEHKTSGIKYNVPIDRTSCDFSDMDKEELIHYLGYEEDTPDQDYDVESLREQATDICNEDEEQDPDIERDFARAEIVKDPDIEFKEYDKSRKFTSASECIYDLMENHKEKAYEIADMEEEYKDRNKTSDKKVEEYIYDLFDRAPQMYEEICSSKK